MRRLFLIFVLIASGCQKPMQYAMPVLMDPPQPIPLVLVQSQGCSPLPGYPYNLGDVCTFKNPVTQGDTIALSCTLGNGYVHPTFSTSDSDGNAYTDTTPLNPIAYMGSTETVEYSSSAIAKSSGSLTITLNASEGMENTCSAVAYELH
jgi:hypothetical protein